MADGAVPYVAMTLADQLPVLQTAIPMLSAPLIILIGHRAFAWWLAMAASLFTLICAYLLMMEVLANGAISYQIGGWAPPLGIEYRVDQANVLVLFLIALIATLVLPYARDSIRFETGGKNETLFYACFMLCLTGLLGIVITGDAFNVFVFLEISSLSTYVMVAYGAGRDRRALTAAYNYLIMGTVGATFFVIGIGFLYMSTGTLNMADLAERIASMEGNRTVQAGFAFIVVGMGLKAAMVPLHLWLPNAYTYAPSAVTVFLAATSTKASIYVLIRFLFSVYQPGFTFELQTLYIIFIPLALIAMFAAGFVAIFQRDFKRMLAYSSISQIGYMLLGIALLNTSGLAASLVHLFNHGITKALLFMAVGALVLRSGNSFYDDVQGLGRRMPLTGIAVVIGGFSLIGVPGTAGFVSKWMLVQAAFETGFWWLAFAVVASSLLAVAYVWRAVETLFLRAPSVTGDKAADPPGMMAAPMMLLAIACVWFGIFTNIPLGTAVTAAEVLLSGPFEMAAPSPFTSALPIGAGGVH